MLALRFLEAILLGFLYGLVPGPTVTKLFTQAIRKNWIRARRIVFWSLGAELARGLACVGILSLLRPFPAVVSALGVFGAMILVHLAAELWQVEEVPEEEPLFARWPVFPVALLYGMGWAFWVTVCTPLAAELGMAVPGAQWLFLPFFALGWLGSLLSLCYLFFLYRPYFQSNKQIAFLLYRTVALFFLLLAGKMAFLHARELFYY